MRYFLTAAVALFIGTTGAFAQNAEVIVERHKAFVEISKAAKPAIAMFKGKTDLDLAVVMAALDTFIEKGKVVQPLFPDDSKEGVTSKGKPTRALPAIWDNKADFDEKMTALIDQATAAKTSITDEDSFQSEFKTVMGTCSACHKKYRAKKKK